MLRVHYLLMTENGQLAAHDLDRLNLANRARWGACPQIGLSSPRQLLRLWPACRQRS